MLSGTAFYRHDENGIVPANIPEEYRWNDTIILVKVPLTAPSGFSFYNYVGIFSKYLTNCLSV